MGYVDALPARHKNTVPPSIGNGTAGRPVNRLQSGQPVLSDYPFEHTAKKLLGSDYDKAIVALVGRLNNSAGAACKVYAFGDRCYTTDQTEKVVNTYVSLCKQGKIPEYHRDKNPKSVPTIEKTVATASGTSESRTAAILYQLYYGVLDSSIQMDKLLWPVTAEKNETNRTTDEKSLDTTVGGTLDDIRWTVKWGPRILAGTMVATVLGGIGYFVVPKFRKKMGEKK